MRAVYVLTLWWLIITADRAGTVNVPQESRAQCLSNRDWILAHRWNFPGPPMAYCIPGASPANST